MVAKAFDFLLKDHLRHHTKLFGASKTHHGLPEKKSNLDMLYQK